MPSQLPFSTLDVFTQTRFKGNPLAIVRVPANTPEDVLTTEQMQTLTKEFNLSETVILYERSASSHDDIPSWNVRIFMVEQELPFAGHPTIGTACYVMRNLAPKGATKGRLLCKAGPIELDYDVEEGVARASIPHNFHLHAKEAFVRDEVAHVQPGLKDTMQSVLDVDVISPVKGMNFVAVELQDIEALGKVGCSGIALGAKLDAEWDLGFVGSLFYVKTGEKDGKVSLRVRMLEKNFEDPATGSACCALGSFLALKAQKPEVAFEIVQAVEMGRQSEIGVEVTLKEDLKEIEKVVLSGSAVKVMEGMVEY